ncbi:MAG: DUF523 and DUF1722 domain-containing protein [Chromatiales bacterium]|jgi:uncharacterized protein YbgA (DUF1722 family)/uncharacterized protein YbbK (DUF523 family)
MEKRIHIGVSSCLLGQHVRFDGGHKHSQYVTQILGEYFDFVPYCPEMTIGLGAPRTTLQLVSRGGEARLLNSMDHGIDHTEAMRAAALQQCRQLTGISAYILKSKSPSCGMERVNLYNESDMPAKIGVGLFAQALMEQYPDLPVEEEGRLNDAHLRENFIERVFAYFRWQQMLEAGLTVPALLEYHRGHKFTLLAHDEVSYRQLGPLVASATADNLQQIASEYIATFMQAMKQHATRKRHMNVLQHIMGFLKNDLTTDDKQELLELLDKYRNGLVPLVVPITLLKYHLRKHPQDYIEQQYYLEPYPEELMLRNYV